MVNHVRIVSLLKRESQHSFEKIEFNNKPDNKTDQFDFLCALFAPRFVPETPKKFLIKEVVFSKPFNLLGYKNITNLTNVIIEIKKGEKKIDNLVKILATLEEKNGKKRYLQVEYAYYPRLSMEPVKGNISDFLRLTGNDVGRMILDEPYSI
jgi:hypothetical protein